jgi:hypothetical protein
MLARLTGLIPKMALLVMLTTPAGVQGSVATLAETDTASPRRPRLDRSILFEVRPPTGEPDAGDPPVRFGGRGDRDHSVLPTPIQGGLRPQSVETPGSRFAGHGTVKPLRDALVEPVAYRDDSYARLSAEYSWACGPLKKMNIGHRGSFFSSLLAYRRSSCPCASNSWTALPTSWECSLAHTKSASSVSTMMRR